MFDDAVKSSMSPLPISRSAPGWSRITRLSASEETEKAIRLGMLALITPVMTSTDGTLGRDDEVDADGPGHLGDAHDGVLDVAGRHHHEVVQLVDDDEDEGQGLRRLGLGLQVGLVLDRGVLLAEGAGRHLAHAAAVRRAAAAR